MVGLLRWRSILLAFFAAALSLHAQIPSSAPEEASPEPAKLLQQVARNYAGATTVRIQEIKEEAFANALYYQWNKSYLTLVTASGNRFRIETRSGWGDYLQTSDGKTEMISSFGSRKYVQHASLPTGPTFPYITSGGNELVREAWNSPHRLESQTSHLTDAIALPDEVITIGGVPFDCFVVRAKGRKFEDQPPPMETFWIDKRSKVIRKYVSQGRTSFADAEAVKQALDTTELFPVVDLHVQANPHEFVQPAPQGTRVATLEPEWLDPKRPTHRTLQQVSASQVLGASQGQPKLLGSYKGHPLLIDFWATWCGPCMESMPAFAHIQEQAAKAGIIVLSIDEDEGAEEAVSYLARHNYTWQNFHDDRGLLRRFGVPSIPTQVVVDADGTIVFNGNPAADHDALYEALHKVGPQFQIAGNE